MYIKQIAILNEIYHSEHNKNTANNLVNLCFVIVKQIQ